MTTTVLFIDPETGEGRQIVQPFATIEELRAAEAQIMAALPAEPVQLDLVDTFLSSLDEGTEFDPNLEATLMGMSDTQFVQTLYSEILRRGADAEGAAFWTQQLAAGAARDDVFAAFVTSDEALSISSPEQVALLGQHFSGIAAGDMG
jgi:hypothetical protein